MAAYIRAVLEDCIAGKVDNVTKIDIAMAVAKLRESGVLTMRHVVCLGRHLCGYTPSELYVDFPDWETLLIQSYAAIEQESGVTDESFVRSCIAQYPKYAKVMPALVRRMHEMGREFNDDLDSRDSTEGA